MKKSVVLGIVLAAVLVTGCTQPEHTKNLVEGAGYSNVVITGYRPFAGSDDDVFKTGFRAKDKNGRVVTGAVCSGLIFKGSTIRFD